MAKKNETTIGRHFLIRRFQVTYVELRKWNDNHVPLKVKYAACPSTYTDY